MFEKLFALLLRLYPAPFRRQYGAEAVALLRDRLRDECGPAHRLCFDLLLDFATGLPQAYRNSYASQVPQTATGLPVFRVLEPEPLRPGSIVMGSIFAIAALAAFVFVMDHPSAWRPLGRLHGLASHPASQASLSPEQVAEKINQQIHAGTAQQSCGFDKLELHPGNIGYLKLNWFPDPLVCAQIAQAVMEKLNDTDAVIIDLRDNRGGFPGMVRLIGDWFFDRATPWYNPRAESPEQSITQPVHESRLTDKPLFILTSARTFSGGEHFAYDLKTLKRATIVGETTSGASHGNAAPPEGTKPVWEGVGVEPDVKVKAADALRTAEQLALSELRK